MARRKRERLRPGKDLSSDYVAYDLHTKRKREEVQQLVAEFVSSGKYLVDG